MLDKYKNTENPFKVPENYFDNFQKEIMNKITEEKEVKIVPLWKKIVPWASVAAIVCGGIISFNVLTSNSISTPDNSGNTQSNEMYASSDDEYFMLYLEDMANNDSYEDVLFSNVNY